MCASVCVCACVCVCVCTAQPTGIGLFWQSAERDYNEFARFYGLPSLSVKVRKASNQHTKHGQESDVGVSSAVDND